MQRPINFAQQKLIQNISRKTNTFNLASIALLAVLIFIFKINTITFTPGLIFLTGLSFFIRSIIITMSNLTYMYRKGWQVIVCLVILAYMIYTLVGYWNNLDMFVLVLGGILLACSIFIDIVAGYALYQKEVVKK